MATKAFKPIDISKYQQLLNQLKELNNQTIYSKDKITTHSILETPKTSSNSQKYSLKQQLKQSYINIDQQINSLEQICRKESYSQWESGAHHQTDSISTQLKQINSKLFEDNRTLIGECIKLRKLLLNSQECGELQNKKLNELQINNLEYKNEINRLKIENLYIRIRNSQQNIHNKSMHHSKHQLNYHNMIEQFRTQISNFSIKLTQLAQKLAQKQKLNSTINSTKISFTKTTSASPRMIDLDNDRQRAIINIKVVYQNRIKNLQQQISLQKQQITRLNRVASHGSSWFANNKL